MIYKTGIVAFDLQLGGGIPAGRLGIFIEDPGAGGELFLYHFALEGIRNGDKVLYALSNNKDLLMEIGSYFKFGDELKNLLIVDLKREIDPMSSLDRKIRLENCNRIVLDDLVLFIKNYKLDDIINFFEFLSQHVRNSKSSVLALLPKGLFDYQTETLFKYIFDIVFELSIKEFENEIQRRMKIIKFRGSSIPKSIVRYEIGDKGIKMESAVRIL